MAAGAPPPPSSRSMPAPSSAKRPVWDERSNRLIWVDIIGQSVHFFDPLTGTDQLRRSCRRSGHRHPTAVRRPRPGHRPRLWLPHESGDYESLVELRQGDVVARMNDGNCDSAGRLLGRDGGVQRRARPAPLYRLDPDLERDTGPGQVTESNGIDWSPDDRLMYYVDSMERRVDVFDFDRIRRDHQPPPVCRHRRRRGPS